MIHCTYSKRSYSPVVDHGELHVRWTKSHDVVSQARRPHLRSIILHVLFGHLSSGATP